MLRVRPLLALIRLLLLAGALAGCLGTAPGDGPGGDDAGGEGDEGEDSVVPYGESVPEEIGSGVRTVEELLLADGGAVGYVFDEESRSLLPGAIVVAHCIIGALELPAASELATTNEQGRFAFPAGPPFEECDQVAYDVVLGGYTQSRHVAGPPLEPGRQVLVFMGLDRL